MAFMTAHQAAEKWGLQIRQVQWLCNHGKVEGAVRFNRSWAIPEQLTKPEDGRTRKKQDVKTGCQNLSRGFIEGPSGFKQILDAFPYSINVTDKDGFMVYANAVFMEGTLEEARDTTIGSYNILDEAMLEQWGLKDHVTKAFQGERVFTPNLKFPNKELVGVKYGKDNAFMSLYNDVNSFPIFDADSQLQYVVTVFVPVRRFMGRYEVVMAKDYIEAHWMEPFDSKRVAKAANMSPSRFQWLFRSETGFSPHDYYIETKMNHIKERLMDSSLNVSQAFNACGTEYNSHYAGLFKNHTGYTPTQFRKLKK